MEENTYSINQSTLEEICIEHNASFSYYSNGCNPHVFTEGIYPWHWHSYMQLFYVVEGEMEYQLPSGNYIFRKGEGGFINSNILHKMICRTSSPCFYIEHLFSPSFIGGYFHSDIMIKYVKPVSENPDFDIFKFDNKDPIQQDILKNIQLCYDLFQKKESCYELVVRANLSLLWVSFFKVTATVREHSSKKISSGRIKAMLLYINEHYQEKITLDQIAEAGACSTRECNRSFKKQLKTSPFGYLNELRLHKASFMLLNSNRSIIEIAEECGFSDSSHFSKSFKTAFNTTPKQYRQENKQQLPQTNL